MWGLIDSLACPLGLTSDKVVIFTVVGWSLWWTCNSGVYDGTVCHHISHTGNMVAHLLTNLAFKCSNEVFDLDVIPKSIGSAILVDLGICLNPNFTSKMIF